MSVHDRSQFLAFTSDVVCAFLQKNPLRPSQVSELVAQVYTTAEKLGGSRDPALPPQEPAVPVRRSVHDEYIICLEDGRKLKTLRRYLRRVYGMTPEEYRRKWGLPIDYPMVAPAYSERRRQLAMAIGLGRGSRGSKPSPSVAAADPALDSGPGSASHVLPAAGADDAVPVRRSRRAGRG